MSKNKKIKPKPKAQIKLKSKPVKTKKPAAKSPLKHATKPVLKPEVQKVKKEVVKAQKDAKKNLPIKQNLKPQKPLVKQSLTKSESKSKKIFDDIKESVLEDLKIQEEVEIEVEEIALTNADGKPYCKETDCDELASSDKYCRYHYLLNWKKIQLRKKILDGGKLERYIEELTARYPDKYIEIMRKDLMSEKDFLSAIQELEIDDNVDEQEFEDDAKNFIDEVRGATGREDDSGGSEY